MTLDKIKEIVKNILDVDPDSITLDSSLSGDFEADSLDKIEIVMAIEEEFGITVEDDAIKSIDTIGDAVNYIEKVMNK